MLRLFIVVATVGRPDVVARMVARLSRQSRRPDGVVVAAVAATDAENLAAEGVPVEVILSEKGSCCQRNNALRRLRGCADVILFLDDDFIAADDYLFEVEKLFEGRPEVVGATGLVLADGIGGSGYGFDEAVAIVEADAPRDAPTERPERALYGCNMAIRVAAATGLTFDEALPLYGWLEDIDFTYRLARRGGLIRSDRLRGVHMGTKGGRTSGVRLGYSQIANPVYMLRKGSAPPRLAYRMMARNVAANVVRSFAPEPHVDRLGRLRGNLLALAHLLTAQLDPRHILALR